MRSLSEVAAELQPVPEAPPPIPRILLVRRGKWERAFPMVWTPRMYHQGDSMWPAWAYGPSIVPEGCRDVAFFNDWLSCHLYEGRDGEVGRIRDGDKMIVVRVLNGSVFERD